MEETLVSILWLLFINNIHGEIKDIRVIVERPDTGTDNFDVVTVPAINMTLSFGPAIQEGVVANDMKSFVNAAFAPIAKATDIMTHKISSLDQKLDSMYLLFKTKLTNIHGTLDSMNSQIVSFDQSINSKIDSFNRSINSKLDTIDERLSLFITEMKNMNQNIQGNNKLITDYLRNQTKTGTLESATE